MIQVNKNTDSLRSLSQIFTPANFHQVVREQDIQATKGRIIRHVSIDSPNIKYGKVLKRLYKDLQNEYCNEYFFKNNLFNKYFLEQYSLKTTSVFNEFKICGSIADFVLLNGTARIFEIKTNLDGLDKLQKQLDDYQKFAEFVYIVTSSKYLSKILTNYANTNIGIIEFTSNNVFKEHKQAESNKRFFSTATIFKSLRKSEYLDIIKTHFGFVPNVPNTRIFKACLSLVNTIDKVEFQRMAVNQLKKRKIQCPELLASKKTPYELKQICYNLDFSQQEYKTLHKFLLTSI